MRSLRPRTASARSASLPEANSCGLDGRSGRWGDGRRPRINRVTVRQGWSKIRPSCRVRVLPANRDKNGVDPRGLEPLASAMRGRSEGFAAVHYRSKNRLDKANPRIVPPRMFAIVRAGCRQIVVSCISKYRASKEALFMDRYVHSTPVHVVLEGSAQEARERMLGRQQTGSMQDPANGLRRISLPRTPVNKGIRKGRGCSKPRPVYRKGGY